MLRRSKKACKAAGNPYNLNRVAVQQSEREQQRRDSAGSGAALN
jgi:hypothetical protein